MWSEDALARLRDSRARWQRSFDASAAQGQREEPFVTQSSTPVPPLVTPLDLEDHDPQREGFPGQAPYTRGIHPTMYRGKLWTMRQYAGFASAEESNARYHQLLKAGQTGLSVAFDLPTQIGLDPDDPRSLGEVGKTGVSIAHAGDMQRLLHGLPLGEVSTSMTINAPASVLLSYYVVAGERQGVPSAELEGTVQNDILKEYMARGTYIFPPGPSMRLTVDLMQWCAEHVPKWNTISISGYHIREAGCTAAQELAFTLADGIAYAQAAQERGLGVDSFAPRLSFFFNAHNDLFEEVAKFRAARRMWARIMTERFQAKDPRSRLCRFHVQTAGSSLTAQEPENNVVRVAVQALAAVLGGAQSLHTNAMDEALALPTQKAARIALRTQQVIAQESGAPNVVDPAGGSYYLEWMTDQLEEEAWELIGRIDGMGGMLRAIERGWPQREIQASAYRWQREVEDGERVVVGVNRYQTEEARAPELHRIGKDLEGKLVAQLHAHRAARDGHASERALRALRSAAEGDANLLPPILTAARAGCTTGETCNAMREVFGEYQAPADV
ncbi:MAG: methylmalonyl-CoA mutase family protein [Halobacteriales archaeon]|nr:methylmalonyl-CoA mutase family protein [Halobacteriales archaeon]